MSDKIQTKWEYLFAVVAAGKVGWVNGEKVSKLYPQWEKRPPLAEFANWLGEEGWELVGLGGEAPLHLAFKRLKV